MQHCPENIVWTNNSVQTIKCICWQQCLHTDYHTITVHSERLQLMRASTSSIHTFTIETGAQRKKATIMLIIQSPIRKKNNGQWTVRSRCGECDLHREWKRSPFVFGFVPLHSTTTMRLSLHPTDEDRGLFAESHSHAFICCERKRERSKVNTSKQAGMLLTAIPGATESSGFR